MGYRDAKSGFYSKIIVLDFSSHLWLDLISAQSWRKAARWRLKNNFLYRLDPDRNFLTLNKDLTPIKEISAEEGQTTADVNEVSLSQPNPGNGSCMVERLNEIERWRQ